MIIDDYDGQMIFGDLVGLKLPDIRLLEVFQLERTMSLSQVVAGGRRYACLAIMPTAKQE